MKRDVQRLASSRLTEQLPSSSRTLFFPSVQSSRRCGCGPNPYPWMLTEYSLEKQQPMPHAGQSFKCSFTCCACPAILLLFCVNTTRPNMYVFISYAFLVIHTLMLLVRGGEAFQALHTSAYHIQGVLYQSPRHPFFAAVNQAGTRNFLLLAQNPVIL